MIRCRQVAEMLTSGRLEGASLRVRMEVRVHLWMCKHCARLARQIKQLGAAASGLAETFKPKEAGSPGEGFEERLMRKLTGKG